MDIFEQVDKVLKDKETRDRKRINERQLIEGSALAELVTRYNRAVLDRQWETAHDCLLSISRLVDVMLTD
jgi:hypothetical protein